MTDTVEARERRKYLTVVYEVGPNPPNPFKTETPFGECVAAGVGDILSDESRLMEAAQLAVESLDIYFLTCLSGLNIRPPKVD